MLEIHVNEILVLSAPFFFTYAIKKLINLFWSLHPFPQSFVRTFCSGRLLYDHIEKTSFGLNLVIGGRDANRFQSHMFSKLRSYMNRSFNIIWIWVMVNLEMWFALQVANLILSIPTVDIVKNKCFYEYKDHVLFISSTINLYISKQIIINNRLNVKCQQIFNNLLIANLNWNLNQSTSHSWSKHNKSKSVTTFLFWAFLFRRHVFRHLFLDIVIIWWCIWKKSL